MRTLKRDTHSDDLNIGARVKLFFRPDLGLLVLNVPDLLTRQLMAFLLEKQLKKLFLLTIT